MRDIMAAMSCFFGWQREYGSNIIRLINSNLRRGKSDDRDRTINFERVYIAGF